MKKILVIFTFLIGLSSVAGGIALILGVTGIPVSDLQGSVFSSYFWPGLILAVVVGGTHLGASVMVWHEGAYAIESLAVAGFGMIIWMFVEICIVGYHSWLQSLYFAFGVATLISVMGLLKYKRL